MNDVARFWLASGADDSTACNSNQGEEKRKTYVNTNQTPRGGETEGPLILDEFVPESQKQVTAVAVASETFYDARLHLLLSSSERRQRSLSFYWRPL